MWRRPQEVPICASGLASIRGQPRSHMIRALITHFSATNHEPIFITGARTRLDEGRGKSLCYSESYLDML